MWLSIGIYVLSWVLLTASLVLQHVADQDGAAAIIWAFVPTLLIVGTSYISTVTPVVSQEIVTFTLAGGLLILTGVNFSKSLRRVRGEYQ
ncbi:MAG: hypothetical protein WBV78_03590 [Roseobacter sp.]